MCEVISLFSLDLSIKLLKSQHFDSGGLRVVRLWNCLDALASTDTQVSFGCLFVCLFLFFNGAVPHLEKVEVAVPLDAGDL